MFKKRWLLRCKFQSHLLKPGDNLSLSSAEYFADLKILEPPTLETGVAYKKAEYHCNCQGNYTLLYKDKPCQNKQAEIGKK